MRARALGGLVVCIVLTGALAASASVGQAATEAGPLSHVVVVAVPGLGWEQPGAAVTPALTSLFDEGGVASVTVRAARSTTCPADGFLTLGAGNRARGPATGGGCPRSYPYTIPVPDATGGTVVREMPSIVSDNADLLHGAVPGALATAVPCVTAVGPFATLAAADPAGRVSSYEPVLPGDDASLASLLSRCPVTVVGLDGLVPDPPAFNDALAAVDGALARVADSRPARSALLVVGVSSVERQGPRLLLAEVVGPGFEPGSWLRSATTNRNSYVQLIDVAPTALALLGRDAPDSMSGQRIVSQGTVTGDLGEVAPQLVDDDLLARTVYDIVDVWWGVLTGLVVAFCVVAYALTAWSRSLAARGDPVAARRVRRGLEVVALSVASVPVATFLTQLLPWWRQLIPAGFYSTWVMIFVGLVVATALGVPWAGRRFRVLGPAGVVAAVTAAVLGADVVLGSNLEFGSINGYNAIVAGRFVGFGNTGFAAYAAGLLLALGVWTERLPRRAALPVMAVVGVVGTAVVANPSWGNDFGGTITLFAAVGVLLLVASRIRINIWWALAVVAGAGLAALAVCWLDYQKPPEERTHFGRFMEDLLNGEAWTVIHRKLANNIDLMLSSPLTFTIPAAAVLAWFVLRRTTSGVPQAIAGSTYLRASVWAVLVCGGIGSVVNDSGVAVAALTITVAVPAVVAAGMRRLTEGEDSAAGVDPTEPARSEPSDAAPVTTGAAP